MVTADEIGGVSIFADLGPVERERLARIAADIRLVPGEYVIHEGDDRALFAVLEGRLETVSQVDGIPRVVGGRGVGELIGEVPITLATRFPFGFRAAEPSRVIRLEAAEYHAIAASAPEVGVKLGALARERIGGLQGIAAEPPPPRAIVVGHRWDRECADLRRFLDRNQVTFRWITPDAPDAADQWGGTCRRRRTTPSFASSTGRPSRNLSFVGWPSYSRSPHRRRQRSTTRSSSAAALRGSPPRCTGPRKD